jgi:hypothetical protein
MTLILAVCQTGNCMCSLVGYIAGLAVTLVLCLMINDRRKS